MNSTSPDDEKYMRRCLQLARNGHVYAAPNPMVGAVIVHEGTIIGEGYHAFCGQGHAEVNAISSVKNESLLPHSTIYVSLEPCAHYGKTPPCADLIIRKGIPRIVIGCKDPFSKVNGLGIQKLRDAGREVVVGVLEEECKALIHRFLAFHLQKRPYITLKWAESADHQLDKLRKGGTPVIISNDMTQMLVHKLRAEHSAILVGRRTALLDNPSLTVRAWAGKNPTRVVIDRRLSLPADLQLFDEKATTIVINELEDSTLGTVTKKKLNFTQPLLPQLLAYLHELGLQSLMVEGGKETLLHFIQEGLWDEAFVEEGHAIIGKGIDAPEIAVEKMINIRQLFGHTFRHYVNH